MIRAKSKLNIYTKYLFLIINLNQQHAYTFVQFSDIAKNWHFCILIIVSISVAPTLDPKTFDKRRHILKRSKCLSEQKLDRRLLRM